MILTLKSGKEDDMPREFPVQWLKTSSGNPYHWERKDLPLVVLFDDNVPDKHMAAWWKASSAWEKSTGINLFRPVGVTDTYIHVFVGVEDLYDLTKEPDEFDYPNPGVLGPGTTVMDRMLHDTPKGARGLEVVLHALNKDTGLLKAVTLLLDSGSTMFTLVELCGHAQGHTLGLGHDLHVPARIMSPHVDGSHKPAPAEVREIQRMYGP